MEDRLDQHIPLGISPENAAYWILALDWLSAGSLSNGIRVAVLAGKFQNASWAKNTEAIRNTSRNFRACYSEKLTIAK